MYTIEQKSLDLYQILVCPDVEEIIFYSTKALITTATLCDFQVCRRKDNGKALYRDTEKNP